MKKVFFLFAVSGLLATACGPTADNNATEAGQNAETKADSLIDEMNSDEMIEEAAMDTVGMPTDTAAMMADSVETVQ